LACSEVTTEVRQMSVTLNGDSSTGGVVDSHDEDPRSGTARWWRRRRWRPRGARRRSVGVTYGACWVSGWKRSSERRGRT